MPVRRKRNGRFGVLVRAPERDGDINLVKEDGSTNGFMKITALETLSDTEIWVIEEKDWVVEAHARIRGP